MNVTYNDDLRYDHNIRYEDNIKYENNLKFGDNLKNEDNLNMWLISNRPNQNRIYQTKPTKPNLQNQTCQMDLPKPNISAQN